MVNDQKIFDKTFVLLNFVFVGFAFAAEPKPNCN